MNSALAMSNPASPSSDADAMDHSSSDERDGTPASTQEEKDVIEAFTFSSMPLDGNFTSIASYCLFSVQY